MTRRAGQVTTAQAVVGVALVLLVLAAVVQLARYVLLPVETDEPLPAPADIEVNEPIAVDEDCDVPDGDVLVVTSSALIQCPEALDGRRVRYRGEVVTAVLRREGFVWVQVNDDPYALTLGPLPAHRTGVGGNSGVSVAIPLALAGDIDQVGSYDTHGDGVQVTGVFHAAADIDDGGPAIVATDSRVVVDGRNIEHRLSRRRVVVAAALSFLALALVSLTVRARRR